MKSNATTGSINQLSELMTTRLKVVDKKFKTSTRDNFEWKNIKRTPQLLRQKAKLESYTIDEEFDDLHENLLIVEKKMKGLSKYTCGYCEGILSVLTHSKNIGTLVKELFDPYHSLPKSIKEKLGKDGTIAIEDENVFLSKSKQSIFREEYELWTNCNSYNECINTIEPSIKNELEILEKMVDSRVNEILLFVSTIKKHVRNRSYALMDYDKTYNNHETLSLKEKSGELSVKQSQQIHNLERKLEEYKAVYNHMNGLLKTELPFFFKLVESILQPIQCRIYYVQLLVSYQINVNLLSIQDLFGINLEELKLDTNYGSMIQEFLTKNRVVSDLVSQLSIINFRENFFNLTLKSSAEELPDKKNHIDNYDSNYKYCHANFSFKGQLNGDLSFKSGAIIKIIDNSGGWWKGELDEKTGLFPGNYVEML